MTYRMTQVLTGHGMFGEYLMKIGRETTDICHHSGGGGQGHGAAHAEVVCGVGVSPLHPTSRHR